MQNLRCIEETSHNILTPYPYRSMKTGITTAMEPTVREPSQPSEITV